MQLLHNRKVSTSHWSCVSILPGLQRLSSSFSMRWANLSPKAGHGSNSNAALGATSWVRDGPTNGTNCSKAKTQQTKKQKVIQFKFPWKSTTSHPFFMKTVEPGMHEHPCLQNMQYFFQQFHSYRIRLPGDFLLSKWLMSGYVESTFTLTLQPYSGRQIRQMPSIRISKSSW